MRARSLLFATLTTAVALTAVPAAATSDGPSTTTTVPVTASSTCPTPTDPKPAPRFTDTTGSVHADSIDCVARWGIAQGTSATTYGPRRDVTRAQMATFVANLIRATSGSLPAGPARFTDTAGSPHAANIDALAAAGIINGIDARTYAPNRNVTRAQAATILAGTYRHLRGADLPEGTDQFRDDDGSPHEANINRLANANIINGRDARTFGHADPLKRDQMASLLARFLPHALDAGTIWFTGWDDGNILAALDPAALTTPRVVHRNSVSSRYTVNPYRREFVHFDGSWDIGAREYVNRVYVHSTTTGTRTHSFRWGPECTGATPSDMPAPEASPDGQWFITGAEAGYDVGTVEIRDRRGACVNAFPSELMTSWTWLADGDLLVVLDATEYDDIDAGYLLGILDRDEIAAGRGAITSFEEIRRFTAGDAPSHLAVSPDQTLIAYHHQGDLFVHDRRDGQQRRVARGAGDLVWPAFSPDGRQIALRNRTYAGLGTDGELHVVPLAGTTEVRSDGPTQLMVPPRHGGTPTSVDTDGPITWTR